MVGAGPFHVVRHHIAENFRYRGEPIEADVSYAFGQAGPAHIQFIAQHDDTPSIYREMYPKGQYGFHHIGLLIHDLEGEIKRFNEAGYETACTLWGGDYVAYMDVELHGDAPIIVDLFNGWKTMHETWDGKTDLIREAQPRR
jgi:hypothetical protein